MSAVLHWVEFHMRPDGTMWVSCLCGAKQDVADSAEALNWQIKHAKETE